MKRIISLLLSILLLASVSAYAESTQEPTSDSFAEEAESLYNLGKQYDKADSSDEDYAKAYDYYMQAAELGNIDAMWKIGVISMITAMVWIKATPRHWNGFRRLLISEMPMR